MANNKYKSKKSYRCYSKRSYGLWLFLAALVFSSCGEKDGAHTTAITNVPPPPRQTLQIVSRPLPGLHQAFAPDSSADLSKPVLVFNLANGSRFHLGEDVPVSLQVQNAKLKGEGGEFRIRYIVDDDDMQWRDTADEFWLTGWLPGKHTIRVELIGPDGWPYKNGNANVVTREISIEP